LPAVPANKYIYIWNPEVRFQYGKAGPERIREPGYELNLACLFRNNRGLELKYKSIKRDKANDNETDIALLS
jgi:hypothetical protein